jgi:hypothetical protein
MVFMNGCQYEGEYLDDQCNGEIKGIVNAEGDKFVGTMYERTVNDRTVTSGEGILTKASGGTWRYNGNLSWTKSSGSYRCQIVMREDGVHFVQY